jgi:hypothetical protein
MLNTLKFGELETVLIDFIDTQDGFLYLRFAGAETITGAIWARLSSREDRGKKWDSPIRIPVEGRSYPDHAVCQKGVNYKTIRTRLPSGLFDVAMLHPVLTVAEDSPKGFHILSYDAGQPQNFFDRLNRTLTVPLKPEWAPFLWRKGLSQRIVQLLGSKKAWNSTEYVEDGTISKEYVTPIERMDGRGDVACYKVKTAGLYKLAWLDLIREELGLSTVLSEKVPGKLYVGDTYVIKAEHQIEDATHLEVFSLFHKDESLMTQPGLPHLLIKAQNELGIYFTLERN